MIASLIFAGGMAVLVLAAAATVLGRTIENQHDRRFQDVSNLTVRIHTDGGNA